MYLVQMLMTLDSTNDHLCLFNFASGFLRDSWTFYSSTSCTSNINEYQDYFLGVKAAGA